MVDKSPTEAKEYLGRSDVVRRLESSLSRTAKLARIFSKIPKKFEKPVKLTTFKRRDDNIMGQAMARRVLGKVGLNVQGKRIDTETLFDTGATRSFVSLKLAERLGYVRYDRPKEVLLATRDKKASMVGELTARVTILGYELPLSHVFGVVEALSHDTIIGMDIMEPYEILVDTREGKVYFRKFPPTIEII